MPGGDPDAYRIAAPFLTAIAAHVGEDPCCPYIGPEGASHYVKMLHNGIEYGDMQLICEANCLMKQLIILSSGNRTALRIYKNLNSHSYATYLFGKQPRIQTINGILEHRAIYESMKAGNVDQVCRLLHAHLENARKKISLSLKLQQNDLPV